MDVSTIIQIRKLQETVDRRMGLAEPGRRKKALPAAAVKLAEKAQVLYDVRNGAKLLNEAKRLAAGDGIVSDVAVPAIFERTVIREALYNLNALQFVDSDTAPFAATVEIPYSYRDTSAAGRNSTRVYEGGEIPRAGVKQAVDSTYPIPQKVAFTLSDEIRYLTGARHIDWNAPAENLTNAARIIAEDTGALLYNEMLQASDEFGAVAVTDEDLEPQADGVRTVLILANFPVVRPRKQFDLQGNQVGNTVNPVAVTYAGSAREEFDGTGTQAAGTYYVLDYNLGEISLVDETGALLIPANGTAYTISYSYATNGYNFDTDEGAVETAVFWDKFLYRYGLRKTEIEDGRYHSADFGLMSSAIQNQIEQAKQFSDNFKKPGTDLTATGDLGRIKDVPNWKTAGPGLWYRDQRVLLGELEVTRFRVLKAWETSEPEPERGPNGRFTGKKSAYGSQWIAVHTPTPLKRAYTSLTLYSGSERVPR